ncbi:hypothetical protein GQ600_24804 [Phytophthora cactorum]|nr:hypothetical protein GQ600_24804 [Phytophthora cactorum]
MAAFQLTQQAHAASLPCRMHQLADLDEVQYTTPSQRSKHMLCAYRNLLLSATSVVVHSSSMKTILALVALLLAYAPVDALDREKRLRVVILFTRTSAYW